MRERRGSNCLGKGVECLALRVRANQFGAISKVGERVQAGKCWSRTISIVFLILSGSGISGSKVS